MNPRETDIHDNHYRRQNGDSVTLTPQIGYEPTIMQAERDSTNSTQFSVSELANALKRTLEDRFGYVRVRGEISGFRGQHTSGHAYFSLKDENARLDAVVWRTTFSRMRTRPQEGLEVIACGKLSTFAGKSSYQIIVESLEPAGVGALMALLEARRRQFADEGLFSSERKRPIPYLPRLIGIVTSTDGAVIRDILHRLAERHPMSVLLWPARVQGEGSAEEIAAAIRGFNEISSELGTPRPDVLIVARGGGSLEDLWSFNEEIVVRAAAESEIPLISAVGHETDWTLLDQVADLRAPTPTAAAELCSPVRTDLLARVEELTARGLAAAARYLKASASTLNSVMRAIPSAALRHRLASQRLDATFDEAKSNVQAIWMRRRIDFARSAGIFAKDLSARTLTSFTEQTRHIAARLRSIRQQHIERGRQALAFYQRSFRAISAIRKERRADMFAAISRHWDAKSGETVRSIYICRKDLDVLELLLSRRIYLNCQTYAQSLQRLNEQLTSVNHRTVLARGYALVTDRSGGLVTSAQGARIAKDFTVRFADGNVTATVKTRPKSPGLKASDPKPQQKLLL